MGTVPTSRRIQRSYTPEEVDRALLEFAISGSSTVARKRLAVQGLDVPERTLRKWKQITYAERYREVAANHAPQVERAIVQEATEIARAAAKVELKALDKELQALDGEVRDASASARNAAVVAGVNIDKILSLSGRPTTIVGHLHAAEIARKLRTIAPEAITLDEGDVEELPDAVEIEPPSENGDKS